MAVERKYVTFVCTGNTCRSPMAEALLRASLTKRGQGLEHLQVASFGLAAESGTPASPNTIKTMQRIGLNLNGHRSQLMTQDHADRSIAIFAMTDGQLELLHRRFNPLPSFVLLLRDVIPQDVMRDIPDPFGGGYRDYEECRDSMIEAIPPLVDFLKVNFSR